MASTEKPTSSEEEVAPTTEESGGKGAEEVVVDLSQDNKREMLSGARTKELLDGMNQEVYESAYGFHQWLTLCLGRYCLVFQQ